MIDRLIEDRFRVTELVARRGPVMTYDAIDLDTGQRVVVKQLRGPLASDPDFVENWEHQLQSVRALGDAAVPTVLAFSATGDELLQVETPPPGVSLRHSIAGRGVLPIEEALALIQAIAGALVPAHRSGVSHGALNPGSIFIADTLDGGMSVFITDWELGEIVTATSETPHALPDEIARYLAPEQLGPVAPPPTPTVDVYALGLILYEFLTGDHPFSVAANDPVLARLTHVPLAPSRYNPDIPPTVERVLLRALGRDPAVRPPHAGAFVTALRQAAATPGVSPARTAVVPVVERVPAPGRERPSWVVPALIGSMLVLLCLFSALLVQLARRPTTPPVAVASVPDVTGLQFDEARVLAGRDNYTLAIAGAQSGSSQPPNTILAQQPPAGALAPASRVISVTLALEPTPVALATIPNLYAQRLDVAEAILIQAGLRLGTIREAHDMTVPSSLVLEQNPRAGLQVPTGTAVDVIVSLGLPPSASTAGGGQAPGPIEAATPTPRLVLLPTVTPLRTAPALPGPTATGPAAPSPTPPGAPGPGPLLFQDDFSTNDAGWVTVDTVEQRGMVVNGRYQIVLFAPGTIWWTQSGREFTNFRYEADVLWVEPQAAGQGLGLIARLQDAQHFYLFEIDQFGNYRVRAQEGSGWRTLQDWTLSSAIQSGLTSNRLAIEAVGENLRFEANDTLLFQTRDGAYLAGDIGLVASNEGTATLTGEFDNVRVVGR